MRLSLPVTSLGTCSGQRRPLGGDTVSACGSLRAGPGPLLELTPASESFVSQDARLELGLHVRRGPAAPQHVARAPLLREHADHLYVEFPLFHKGNNGNFLVRLCGRIGGSKRGPRILTPRSGAPAITSWAPWVYAGLFSSYSSPSWVRQANCPLRGCISGHLRGQRAWTHAGLSKEALWLLFIHSLIHPRVCPVPTSPELA